MMMKLKLILRFLVAVVCVHGAVDSARATHILGGELYYDYLGQEQFEVFLKLYSEPTDVGNGTLDYSFTLGVYSDGVLYESVTLYLDVTSTVPVQVIAPESCQGMESEEILQLMYSGIVSLPSNDAGYDLTIQRCCFGDHVDNLLNPVDTGIALVSHVPAFTSDANPNSSPRFGAQLGWQFCLGESHELSNVAWDPDGDEIIYEWINPLSGGSPNNPAPLPPLDPQFLSSVSWASGYAQNSPFPSNTPIELDPYLGTIGFEPNEHGAFVFAIQAIEMRDGMQLSTTFREMTLHFEETAPLVPVTFQVDMNNETVSSDGIHIAGGFQGWDPSATLLTDDDSDGVYELTIELPADSTYEFKFINGASWDFVEDVPPTCQVEVSGNDNRFVAVGADDTEVTYHICWESCAACGMTTVRFRVDMMHEDPISPNGVHVAGNFQGWNPSTSPLSDSDGDGVWETWASFDPLDITDGVLLFKFINGNSWSDPNESMTDQACANDFGNRVLTFEDDNMFLNAEGTASEAPCFNSCESCVLPEEVTFRVDMTTQESVSPNGVHVAGSFQGWNPSANPLYDDDGDGIWEATYGLMPGEYQFKFINGNDWGGNGDGNVDNEAVIGICTADGSDNRALTVAEDAMVYQACYNECTMECQENPVQLPFNLSSPQGKVWRLDGEGSYMVGPAPGSGDWWGGLDAAGVVERYCQMDDEFIFYDDGTFVIDTKGDVWAESYMGGNNECLTDESLVAPFDVFGSGTHTFTATDNEITVNGLGAWIGWNKPFNGGELANDGTGTPVSSITYDVHEYSNNAGYELLTITIDYGQNPGEAYWTMRLRAESSTGCMDDDACNFDPGATVPDASACIYPELNQDCGGYCIDPTACNYIENPGSVSGVSIYSQSFEGFSPGDYVSDDPNWITWGAGQEGTDGDAQISDEQAHTGENSLHIYANSAAGGPLDVVMLVGLDEGVYTASWMMYVTDGNSAYYNIQEDVSPGVGWAFDVTFAFTGDLQVVMDGATVGSGVFPIEEWFEVRHDLDLDNDLITLTIAGNVVGSFTFDSPFGGVNFFGYGDGTTVGNWFMDDMEIHDGTEGQVPAPCTYPGCMDPAAFNYDATAGCEEECIYLTYDCASIGYEAWSTEDMGLFPDWQEAVHGVAWEGEWVLNIPETIVEPGSGVVYGVHHMDWTGLEGLPDWVEMTSYNLGELDASSQHCIAASGTPAAPGLHEINATGEVFISIFGQPFSIGEQSLSAWLEVAENPNPIPGCTYANAVNFVSYANDDDGSCLFAGCTDATAGNFNPIATIDDGSCGEGCDPAGDSTCQADNDGDGIITVSDLLILLAEFGATCE